jgi:hypothetical protein
MKERRVEDLREYQQGKPADVLKAKPAVPVLLKETKPQHQPQAPDGASSSPHQLLFLLSRAIVYYRPWLAVR